MKKILQYGALFCSQSVSLEHCSPYFAAPAVVHKLQHSTRKSESAFIGVKHCDAL